MASAEELQVPFQSDVHAADGGAVDDDTRTTRRVCSLPFTSSLPGGGVAASCKQVRACSFTPPNYGMAANRCESDRILLKLYRDSAKKNFHGESPSLHIIDARAQKTATASRMSGAGTETPHHYDDANVEFTGIANIHAVRDSIRALESLLESDHTNFHSRLESTSCTSTTQSLGELIDKSVSADTKWLKHIIAILSGARRVAEILHEESASVLVLGTDGWDRTPQLVSLAQLMLDPYYRTIRGFAVLIEKEWCAYGHKFADRIGVGTASDDEPNERYPVMIQFLDCVWQITRQFPTAFEFNEKLLLHVSDALVSGLYGTLLYNTKRERILEKVWKRTESVWTPVLASMNQFSNLQYRHTDDVLYPRADEMRVVMWEAMYNRWDAEKQLDYMTPVDHVACLRNRAIGNEQVRDTRVYDLLSALPRMDDKLA